MKKRKNLIIAGTGLFAELSKAYFEEYTNYRLLAFVCHKEYKKSDSFSDSPLYTIEELETKFPKQNHEVFIAIGYGKMNKMRQSVYNEIKELGYNTPSFVHPNVKIWDSTSIGDNVFIFEDNTIQPFTRIGNNTIFWSGNHFGHHSKIGNHCFVSSHVVISGCCDIGDNAFIGVNSTFHDSINVGKSVLIGAGSIIGKNIENDSVYVPNRTAKYRKTSKEIGF